MYFFLIEISCPFIDDNRNRHIYFPFTVKGYKGYGWCATNYEYQNPGEDFYRNCTNGGNFDPTDEQKCVYSPAELKMNISDLVFSLDYYVGYVKGNLVINDVSPVPKRYSQKHIYVLACWTDKEIDVSKNQDCRWGENRYVGKHEYPFKNNTLLIPLNLNGYFMNMTHFTIMIAQNDNGKDLSMDRMYDYYHRSMNIYVTIIILFYHIVDHCPPETMLDGSYVKYPASYPGEIDSRCSAFFVPMPNVTFTRVCQDNGYWKDNEAKCWLGPSDGTGEVCIFFIYIIFFV